MESDQMPPFLREDDFRHQPKTEWHSLSLARGALNPESYKASSF
jgi:hypothetical protein